MEFKRIWSKFLVNFVNGIVIILPVFITVLVIKFLVIQLNKLILDPLMRLFLPLTDGVMHMYIAKIIIFLLVIKAVALIGWGARVLFIRRIFSFGEKLVIKLPFLGKIYHGAKQVFSSIIGEGKAVFTQVVLVEYPRVGLYSVGFMTGESSDEIKDVLGDVGVNVFMPTTPNPTSGLLIIIPRSKVQPLNMSVEDGMKLVISGGVVSSRTM